MTLQVFVSYKSEYRDFARKVRDQLRDWGYETWFDMDNIPKGAYFRHAIQEGLDTSDVLVSVITPEAQNSREVMAEVDYFLSQNKPLVPLKRGDFKLLYIFITIQYIDFTRDEAEAFADLHKRLAELAAVESPAPPPTEEALAEPEPADGKKADEHLLPAANQPQRPLEAPAGQPVPSRKNSLSSYRLPLAIATLAVIVGNVVLFNLYAEYLIPLTHTSTNGNQISLSIALVIIPMVAIGIYGSLFFYLRRRSRRTASILLVNTNRARMLDKVYDFWVVGVLENALQESGAFEVGLAAVPGAVLRHKDYGDYPLPPNAKIIDIFNDLNRELLILGAPGAGKTILLLQLAKALIGVARGEKQSAFSSQLSANTQKAIPVVFNLSSWAAERKPLNEWIVEELRLRYQVPKKVAEMWVAEQVLLLLLDGLDEVAEQYRDVCVDAINAFREQYPAVDIAVCSRIADYEMLTRKLDLRGAVTLQPLNDAQIDGYINRPELTGLRQIMSEDSVLREMATTPFLLNAMAYAYRDVGAGTLRILPDDNTEARRTRLLESWADKRLQTITFLTVLSNQKKQSANYKLPQAKHYLAWLAKNMFERGQSVFYIENMQPDWITQPTLPTLSARIRFVRDISFVLGYLLFVLGFVFIFALISSLTHPWAWLPFRRAFPTLYYPALLDSALIYLFMGTFLLAFILIVIGSILHSRYFPAGEPVFVGEIFIRWLSRFGGNSNNIFSTRIRRMLMEYDLKKKEREAVREEQQRTKIKVVEQIGWSWRNVGLRLFEWLLLAIFALGLCFLTTLIAGSATTYLDFFKEQIVQNPLINFLAVGIAFGLVIGSCSAVLNLFITKSDKQTEVPQLSGWSRLKKGFNRLLVPAAVNSSAGGLIAFLILASSWFLGGDFERLRVYAFLYIMIRGFAVAGAGFTIAILIFVMFVGGPYYFLTAIVRGIVRKPREIRFKPNQGIQSSARYALIISLPTFILLFVFVLWLNDKQTKDTPSNILVIGTILSLIISLQLASFFGGAAVWEHLNLRFSLYQAGNIPWNYARFLDTCAKIGLLRKVGGGYIFAHRYLLEYFAGLESSAGK